MNDAVSSAVKKALDEIRRGGREVEVRDLQPPKQLPDGIVAMLNFLEATSPERQRQMVARLHELKDMARLIREEAQDAGRPISIEDILEAMKANLKDEKGGEAGQTAIDADEH
ncbi:MAG: hypothetical protein AAF330_01615 [Pseudomonadota bacterium]